MLKFALAALLAFASVGISGCCENCKDTNRSDSQKMSSGDACPKCPGVQTMKADGTCSGCGMKVVK